MNKKFSTLVAVLLAAGAWTTLDAKVVIAKSAPTAGQSYVIGTALDASAVALVLDQLTEAKPETPASSGTKATAGAEGATLANIDAAAKWQLIGETITTTAKLKVTVDGTAYYLCYAEGAFSLSTKEDDANILNVKDAAEGLTVVADGKTEDGHFLSVGVNGLELVESDPVLVVIGESDATLGSLAKETNYVLASAKDLTKPATSYVAGFVQAKVDAAPAFYSLKKSDAAAIEDATKDIWTVTAVKDQADQFTLSTTKDDVTYVVVNDEGTLKAIASGQDVTATAFKLVQGELTLADGSKELDWSSTLGMINATTADLANAIQFGQWEKDEVETPAELPGLSGVTTGNDGKVTAIKDGETTIPAPFYFKVGDTYLSVVTDKNGNYVIAEGKDAIKGEPNAAQSAAASWKLENGKLISVASERAKKTVALSAASAAPASLSKAVVNGVNFSTVGVTNAPSATVGNNGEIYIGGVATGGNLYVSATSIDIDGTISTSGDVVSGGTQKSAFQKLLTGVPSGYAIVGVKQASGDMEYLYTDADGNVSTETFDAVNNDYKGYLWKVSETNDNKAVYYYQFTSLRQKGGKAIQWIIDNRAQFTAAVKYEGNGFTLSHPSGNIKEDGTAEADAQKAVIGIYEAPLGYFTNSALNAILNPGFEMTVEIEKDSKDKLENIDIFSGKMYQKETTTGSNTYVLWNNKDFKDGKDAKMLVLNKAAIDGDNAKGVFEWVTEKEYNKDLAADQNYVNDFRFFYDLSTPSTDIVTKMMVGSYTVSVLEVNKKFYLTSVNPVTDTSKLPYIKLGANNIYPVKDLLGKLWNITYADSKANANAEDEAYKLNGILAVTYDKDGKAYAWDKDANSGNGAWVEDTTDPTSVADYVASSTVAESAPEAQWMVTAANLNTNTFTLTNRENPAVKITGIQLRLRDGDKFEVYITPDASDNNGSLYSTSETNLKGSERNSTNDIIYLTESVKKDNFQGYMQSTENTLRSNNYHLGQYHAIGGNHNAYFVENHANSHQIGAIADKAEADKWKLHFAMKADDDNKYTEVDTVYVIKEYATLNADKNGWETDKKKIQKDTLAILPYTFQKVANREFVAFNPEGKANFDFYACDGDNKDNSASNYTEAARFALKVKPNGYNFVEIAANNRGKYVVLSSDKAYLANSAENGSLERMQTYAPDNNSVMVVEAADASEYHKIAQVWGDTIKLFRDENNSQVMFEKRDAKSVVAKDTLSFLNIDNVNQFNVNPAIFADTAYINRWDADGVLNTTYQYLLAVNPSFGYHVNSCNNPSHKPEVSNQVDTVYGRFLVNLIDTANVYGVNHIHNNWYTNDNEAGEKRAKLSFVEGYHTNDTLYLTRQGGETVKLGMTDPEFNVAKFAFRYVDSAAKTFKIQTQFKTYLPDTEIGKACDTAEDFTDAYDKAPSLVSNEGYLKWINGTVVVEKGYENGDVFGIEENYEGNPVANEDITTSSISVTTTTGKVIINGAAGKKVTISNVLGQTIANTVLSSDNATLSAPAGIVVVAVEGEAAVKAIVK